MAGHTDHGHAPRMTPELTAFCRGFLLTKCHDVGCACVFCRAFLIRLYGPA